MSTSKIYLVTGANRGIGKGFVQAFLQKPSATVIAAVRDPGHATTQALASLPKAEGSTLIIVKLDSSTETDAAEAVATLRKDHGITSLDVVIANAGISNGGDTVRQTTVANTIEHFKVNTIGPLVLFQATAEMLKASKTQNPIFIGTSTLLGSLGYMEALQTFPAVVSPYGGSKAALNWFVRRLHFEEPWLTSFVFHPGLVTTDLALGTVNDAATLQQLGAISVETSVAGMTKTIDVADRNISGTFQNYNGQVLPW